MKKRQTRTRKNKPEVDFSVHTSIENRKKFKALMILRFVLLIAILCGCAVMVMFGGWEWKPDEGFSPTTNPKEGWQYALIWLGAIIALLSIVGYVLWTIKTFKWFYNTQEQYFKTKDFKDKKEKALQQDPSKLNKSTIKWYKKLGYLTGAQKTEWLSKLKPENKKPKIFKKVNKEK